MRERREDTALAVGFSLLLHLVPVAVLLMASLLPASPPSSAGEPVNADVVDPNALSADVRAALRTRPAPDPSVEPPPPDTPPEPPPEPLPDALEETPPEAQPLPQEQLPDPDPVDQQEVKPDATSADTAQREQEAKQRQGQVDLTDERQRQQQAEQRKTEMQRQRDQQLADIQRQKEQNQREIALAQQRLEQLAQRRAQQASATAAASAPPGQRGADPNTGELYRQALMEKIRDNWTRPDNVPPGQACKIVIRQIPGGTVIDAQVDPSCPYDEAGRRSVEAAVLKAQPLPYQGFESVFNRTLILNFRAEDR
ncbi:MAG: TonB C-terminal domain-containing protein [Lysobacteraceae bacterium]